MPVPLKAGLPPELVLDGDYKIRLTALDAATGAVVGGVVISERSLLVTQFSGPPIDTNPDLLPITLLPGSGTA